MKPLTERQKETLQQVDLAWQEQRLPIVREIAERMGLAGESSLTPTLHRLQNMGYVLIQGGVRGKPRVITLTSLGKAVLKPIQGFVEVRRETSRTPDLLTACERLLAGAHYNREDDFWSFGDLSEIRAAVEKEKGGEAFDD